jgi:hypothetical protein
LLAIAQSHIGHYENNLLADTPTTVFNITKVDWPHRSPLLAIAQTHIGHYETIYRPTRQPLATSIFFTGHNTNPYRPLRRQSTGRHANHGISIIQSKLATSISFTGHSANNLPADTPTIGHIDLLYWP